MSDQNKENWEKYRNENENVKEPFCGACMAIPFAFAGIGASAYGASSRGQYKKQKKWALWSGIATTLLSIFIAIYYLYIKKCVDCGYVD
jgi:hypothetical protein